MFRCDGVVAGKEGLPKVVLHTTNGESSAEVYLHGCTLTSWKCHGEEKLFVSDSAIFNGVKAIRGGIPLVFPQFGKPEGSALAQHGFARNSSWNFDGVDVSESEITASFSLIYSEETLSLWPFKFKLSYKVEMSLGSLVTSLKIQNLDDQDILIQCLLHTYFRVPNISSIAVKGFESIAFSNSLRNGEMCAEEKSDVNFEREIDQIYRFQTSQASLEIHDVNNGRRIVKTDISAHISSSSVSDGDKKEIDIDCVLWNPWIEKGSSMADLHPDGYKDFVCIEPGIVSRQIAVMKGKELTLAQKITV